MTDQTASYADFEALRAALGLPDEFELCSVGWEESQQRYETEAAGFLSPEFVETTCAFLKMAPEVVEAFRHALPLIRANEALMRFAWHGHHMLCKHTFDRDHSVGNWPPVPEHLGEPGRMLYAFVFLSGTPFLRELHAARGIPEEVTADTLNDIQVWMRTYQSVYGELGFDHNGWMMNRFREALYQLGRLQFEIAHYKHDYHAFRNRETRELRVLAGDGMRFRRDGLCDGTNDILDEEAWTATYRRDEGAVHGCPITPDGRAHNRTETLDLTEWDCVLEQGAPILSVHISQSGPMGHAACVDSYRRAIDFFPKYVPEHPFDAFYTATWLLDHQLGDHLPASSNIVRFLRDWYIIPGPGANDHQTIERTFGFGVTDPFSVPAKTTLQKKIVEHMKNGGRWHGAMGLIFPEDVGRSITE